MVPGGEAVTGIKYAKSMTAKKKNPKPPGRKKGVPNKLTTSAKTALMEAFNGLGGVDAMIQWADRSQRNRGEFYKIWSKLLPKEITGLDGGPISLAVENLKNVPDDDLDAIETILERAASAQAEHADAPRGASGEGPPAAEELRSAGVADPEPGPAA